MTQLEFTYDPIKKSFFKDANDQYDLGLLAKGQARPDLSSIYDLTLLDKVLAEKGLPPIQGVISGLINKNNTSGDALGDIVS